MYVIGVATFERGLRQRTRSGRVRADVFSTRYKISSNRPNGGTGMYRLGRSEAGAEALRSGPRARLADVERGYGYPNGSTDEEYPAAPVVSLFVCDPATSAR